MTVNVTSFFALFRSLRFSKCQLMGGFQGFWSKKLSKVPERKKNSYSTYILAPQQFISLFFRGSCLMFSTTSASWWAFLTIHTQMGDIFYFVFLARGFFVGSKWPYGDMLIVFFIIPAEEGPHCHERRAGSREKMAAKKFKDETSSFNLKPPKFKLEMLGGKMVLARKTLYEMRTMINLTKLSYKWGWHDSKNVCRRDRIFFVKI